MSSITIAIIRAIMFFWVSLECFFLFWVYWYGYSKYKSTPIIRVLTMLFLSMGFFYAYLVGTALLYAFNLDVHEISVAFMPFLALPVGYFLNKFRNISMDADENKQIEDIKTAASLYKSNGNKKPTGKKEKRRIKVVKLANK